MSYFSFSAYLLVILIGPSGDKYNESFQVKVEAEETVYAYEPANNGAGPMWTHGNTTIVRYKNKVFASGLETLKDVKPYTIHGGCFLKSVGVTGNWC